MKNDPSSSLSRRHFLSVGAASVVLPAALQAASPKAAAPVQPPDGKGILISPKLGMLPEEVNGKKLSLAERLELAGEAGFDGVDLDQAGAHTLEEARDAVLDIHLDDSLEDYIIEIVLATRDAGRYGEELAGWIQHGASPRATMALDRCARAYAWLNNRDYVVPEDIQLLAPDVLRHRVLTTYEAEAENVSSADIVQRILDYTDVP